MKTTQSQASLGALKSQINNNHRRALSLARSSIEYALKCGQALAQAKLLLPHGEWLPWLAEHCPELR